MPARLVDKLMQSALRVDREAHIIFGVKLVGNSSTNRGGILYRPALEQSLDRYEGAPVYPGHLQGDSDRKWQDAMAVVRNPRLEEDGLYGDLHGIEGQGVFAQLLSIAERAPHLVGSSHEAWVVLGPSEDPAYNHVAVDIEKVEAISIVDDPATTMSLFEGMEHHPPETLRVRLAEAQTELRRYRLQEVLDRAEVPKGPTVRSERWLGRLMTLPEKEWPAEITDRLALLQESRKPVALATSPQPTAMEDFLQRKGWA